MKVGSSKQLLPTKIKETKGCLSQDIIGLMYPIMIGYLYRE
jgi:hypothetical protein